MLNINTDEIQEAAHLCSGTGEKLDICVGSCLTNSLMAIHNALEGETAEALDERVRRLLEQAKGAAQTLVDLGRELNNYAEKIRRMDRFMAGLIGKG